MRTLLHDIRYAFRSLRRSPGFTATALLTLALGIGATTAIFTLVNGFLLRPLPYPKPDRLVFLSETSEQVPNMSISWPNYQDWVAQNRVFDGIGAFRGSGFILIGQGQAERLLGAECTGALFSILGVKPALGRTFQVREEQPGGERVVVLSHGLWNRRFGGDKGILGRALTLNGDVHTVIGVMPAGFQFPTPQIELWSSLGRRADQMAERGSHPGIYAVARLKPGRGLDQARSQMNTIAGRLAGEYPNTNRGNGVIVTSLHERAVRGIRPALMVLGVAVILVLLIACANVANLLLARATARYREFAVRAALGAGRWRLVRQLLTESLLLALLGGAAGLALARAGTRALIATLPIGTPRIHEVVVDGEVLFFALAVSVFSSVLFGLAPAWRVSRRDLHATLKEGGRGSGGSSGHRRFRGALVVAEVALSMVLLVGAALLLRSFGNMISTNPGLNVENVLTLQVALPPRYKEPQRQWGLIESLVGKVKTLPGVQYTGAVLPLPMGGSGWQTSFSVEGAPEPDPGKVPSTDWARVTPEYFRAMRIPLRRGRVFTESDSIDAQRVAVIDETFARRYWPQENPIGKRIRFGSHNAPNPWMTIVGVVGHVKNYGVDQDSRVETYVPFAQMPGSQFSLVVRSHTDPAALTAAVRSELRSLDPDLPAYNVATMERIFSDLAAPRRLAALLLALFAALALLMAAVGIYGVISYSVSRRTGEIGVRMALGAGARNIFRLVLREGALLAGLGVAVGLVAAFALTRFLETFLFGVQTRDRATFVAVPVVLAAIALVASWVPARRATRVDPVVALRFE